MFFDSTFVICDPHCITTWSCNVKGFHESLIEDIFTLPIGIIRSDKQLVKWKVISSTSYIRDRQFMIYFGQGAKNAANHDINIRDHFSCVLLNSLISGNREEKKRDWMQLILYYIKCRGRRCRARVLKIKVQRGQTLSSQSFLKAPCFIHGPSPPNPEGSDFSFSVLT